MSLTMLLWPSAKVHPAVLVLMTCFPAISNTDFEFSVCSLVLMISHHLFHLFLLPFLCQCHFTCCPRLNTYIRFWPCRGKFVLVQPFKT